MTSVDLSGAKAKLANTVKQTTFAASQALNLDGAPAAQRTLLKGYEDRFTLRQPQFFKIHGARITRSTKANLVAEVGTTDKAKFLGKHVAGGEFGPADGKGKIAIPTDNVRRNKRDLIPGSQRPRALIAAGGFFKGPKSGLSQLAKAVGRGKARAVRTYYLMVSRIRVKPILRPVIEQAAKDGVKAATEAFPKRFQDAMRTSK
jgi:hypothetical protein